MSDLIPDGWEIYKIREVATPSDRYSFTGGPFGSDLKSEDYTESGVRIIQLQNIGDGVFKNKYKIYTSELKANQLHSCNIYPDDIILSKMGDPVARATIIPSFSPRYVMASDGIRLSVNNEKFNTKFIHDTINAEPFRTQAELNSTGSTRKRIGLTQLRELTFISPPLPEQQKIAAILTSVDEVIEKTQAQIDKLKDLKTGMMQTLLTIGVGIDGNPHTEFKDSPVGRIPKGWEVSSLIDLSVNGINNGIFNDPKKVGKGYKLINVVEMYRGFGIDIKTLKLQDCNDKIFNRNKVEYGDVFFTRSSLKLEGIAFCNINLSHDDDITYDGHLMRVRPDVSRILPKFLAYYCLSNFARKSFMANAKHSTMTTIGQADIAPLSVALPTLDEQEKIVKSIDSIENTIKAKASKLDHNKRIKKALMQDLLTGKVRVNVSSEATDH